MTHPPKTTLIITSLAAATLLATGCATSDDIDDDDAWSQAGKADDPSLGGVTSTFATNAILLDGFHKLLDTPTGECVTPRSTATPPYSVGAIEKPFDLHFIATKNDLAKTLGVDVGLQINVGGTSIGPTVGFLDNFRQTRTALHLLVAARATYRVTNLRKVALTDEALGWLDSDPRTFLHRCGNFYVNGIGYQAQLFVMIRLDTLSEDAARSISADLGIGGVTKALGIDATVKAKLEDIARRQDVIVETHVLDRGFFVDSGTGALISSLLDRGLSSDAFTKIDAIRNTMLASLASDACRDGGVTTDECSGGPGYFANMARHAVASEVDLRPYARASNAPLGGPGSAFEQIRALVDGANRYLRALSRAVSRIDAILDDEIAPFLAASTQRRAGYGIAPPAAPVYRLAELVASAQQSRDRFAEARMGVETQLASCWGAAVEGALEACSGSPPEMASVDTVIGEYVAGGRIVPVRYASKGVLGYNGAKDACAASGMRLPTLEEAQRLAIPIGYATLPRTSEDRLRYAAWHANTSKCTNGELSAFSNPPTGTPGNVCTPEGWWTPHPTLTLCVPASGPIETLAAP